MFDAVTIANGEAVSTPQTLGNMRVTGIQIPASWTTANLTFLGSANGVTYDPIYDEAGAEYSVTATAGKYIPLDAGALELSAPDYIKVRSGTVGTPVNQGAARQILLSLK